MSSAASSNPRIRRNALLAGGAEGSRAIFAAILLLGLTRVLGPDDYGLFALAVGVGTLAMLPSDFGLSAAAGRFVAERRGDPAGIARMAADAMRLKLVLSGAVSVVLAAAAPAIAAAYGEPGLTLPIVATAAALFCQSVFTLVVNIFVSMGRVSMQTVLYGGESALELLLVLGAALLGGGAGGAAFGRAGAFGLGALAGAYAMVRLLGRGALPRRRPAEPGTKLLAYSAALFVVEGTWAIFVSIDLLLIGAYLTSADVGQFQAPQRLMAFVLLAGAAAATAVAPRVARHADEDQATPALILALRALLVLGIPAAAVCAVWADPLVQVALGPEFAPSAEVLRALAPWLVMSLLAPLVTLSLNFLGQARKRIPIVLIALAINTVLDILLIPRIGIVAGAIATGVAFAFYLGAHLVLLRRELDLDLRPVAATAVRAAVAASCLAGVLALAGTGAGLAPWRLLVAGCGAGVLYLAVLLVLGEVPRGALRERLARVRG